MSANTSFATVQQILTEKENSRNFVRIDGSKIREAKNGNVIYFTCYFEFPETKTDAKIKLPCVKIYGVKPSEAREKDKIQPAYGFNSATLGKNGEKIGEAVFYALKCWEESMKQFIEDCMTSEKIPNFIVIRKWFAIKKIQTSNLKYCKPYQSSYTNKSYETLNIDHPIIRIKLPLIKYKEPQTQIAFSEIPLKYQVRTITGSSASLIRLKNGQVHEIFTSGSEILDTISMVDANISNFGVSLSTESIAPVIKSATANIDPLEVYSEEELKALGYSKATAEAIDEDCSSTFSQQI